MNAQILDRFQVTDALNDIIQGAKNEIILISPYVKLNNLIKSELSEHKLNKDFRLTVVYGKNEEDNRMSLSESDMEFFKSFPNVEVRYHKRLHAKLYANDFDCLISSMNLHDYSMNQNIEVGIFLKRNRLREIGSYISDNVSNSLEDQARGFADYIIEKSELHFKKEIEKEKSFFGLVTNYKESHVIAEKQRMGFCIKTKASIPYNPKMPYSHPAYDIWNKWHNENYQEKYCHKCGETNKLSMAKPLCFKCFSSHS